MVVQLLPLTELLVITLSLALSLSFSIPLFIIVFIKDRHNINLYTKEELRKSHIYIINLYLSRIAAEYKQQYQYNRRIAFGCKQTNIVLANTVQLQTVCCISQFADANSV